MNKLIWPIIYKDLQKVQSFWREAPGGLLILAVWDTKQMKQGTHSDSQETEALANKFVFYQANKFTVILYWEIVKGILINEKNFDDFKRLW